MAAGTDLCLLSGGRLCGDFGLTFGPAKAHIPHIVTPCKFKADYLYTYNAPIKVLPQAGALDGDLTEYAPVERHLMALHHSRQLLANQSCLAVRLSLIHI